MKTKDEFESELDIKTEAQFLTGALSRDHMSAAAPPIVAGDTATAAATFLFFCPLCSSPTKI